MTADTTGLVSSTDIAELAGVSRGAVSNWRRRHEDFPKPASGPTTKPLFSRAEVTSWLLANGHELTKDSGQTAVWAFLNQLRGHWSVTETTDLLLELLVARKTNTSAVGLLERVPSTYHEDLQEAINRVALGDLAEVGDYALERLERSQGKMGGASGFVGSRTTAILASLAAARPGGVLYDPACGIAASLLEAVTQGAAPQRIIGHDLNSHALQVAAHRAALHEVDLELVRTDVLATDIDPSLAADTIILEPPFGLVWDNPSRHLDQRFQFGSPPRSSADTAWLQHVVAHLSEAGRGYVLTPMGTLSRGISEARIRAELLRHGCIETIIGLPGKLLPQTSIPLALWVLRRPHAAPDDVLLIDASTTETPETHVAAWLNDPTAREAVPHTSVPIAELIAADSVLTPARWVGQTRPEPADITASYSRERAGISTSVELLERIGSGLPQQISVGVSRVVTVGELVEQGVLELRPGRHQDGSQEASEDALARVVKASDIREGTLPQVASPDPHLYPDATVAGDVLVTTTHTVRARVDESGGHLPAAGVHRLRVLNEDVVVAGYLAFALSGSWNERLQTGTTIQRTAVRELEVPLVSKADQLQVREALDAFQRLAEVAAQLASQADAVTAALLEAVRFGIQLPPMSDSDERNVDRHL